MKKSLLSALMLSASTLIFAQVGIGTNTPQATLDVVGTPANATIKDGLIAPRLTRTQLIAKNSAYIAAQTGAIVYVTDISGTADAVGGKAEAVTAIGYYYFDSTAKWVKYSIASDEPWRVQGGTTPATTNAQNIYQTGKVAIGSGATLPTSTAQLFVTGDVESTGKFISGTSIYADYVFEKYFTGTSLINAKYNFTPLSEVKDFVAKNHHLPGVTPINDLAKTKGGYKVDLTELSIQQLEKLEELYLHVIEQQEQLNEKDQEIQSLKNTQNDLIKRLEALENKSSK